MKLEKVCRIVSKNAVVIQKGERAGEVVYRMAVASGDGDGSLVDIQAKIDSAVFDSLVLFIKEYNVVFEYAVKSFNGRSYTDFSIVSVQQVAPVQSEKK